MIYDLTIENNEIIAERKRVCKDTNKLILGLYENHFIQIKDVNKLCKKYRCQSCNSYFTRNDNLVTHQKSACGKLYMDQFTNDIREFTHEKNIMKKILEFCAVDKPFVYPYFGVYDFESMGHPKGSKYNSFK